MSYPKQTLLLSVSSLDIKIYVSKQKKLSKRTAFLITHFPLFTTMFISQLVKEAELKHAQLFETCFVFHYRFQTLRNNKTISFSFSLFGTYDETLELVVDILLKVVL